MYKIISIFLFIVFTNACGGINFVYNNDINLDNPIYNKTNVYFTGVEIPSIYIYSTKYFGTKKNYEFDLGINIEESQTKKSIKVNQVVSKIDYEIIFNYTLDRTDSGCEVYKKTILSRFSYVPKSEGFNFASDQSLKNLYELATQDNMQQFVNLVSNINSFNCINEN